MARSHYTSLIRRKADRKLVGAFTVKHEGNLFARTCGQPLETLEMAWMADCLGHKQETVIPWKGR